MQAGAAEPLPAVPLAQASQVARAGGVSASHRWDRLYKAIFPLVPTQPSG